MPHTDLIIEHLPNGLRVVLRPMYTAPIVTQAIWYRVGARNDPPGRTGISHWVEHMLFHGTPQYPSQWLERQIARCGGFWNASTTLDWTVYYEVVPSANAALLYPLEADRMHNALFRPQDVEQERQVILTERLQNEDSPTYRLMRKVMRTALPNHPYGNPVIGEVQDLQAIDRQALYEHYRRWYTPANATLVWCGDFDPQQVLEALKAAFAEVPAAPIPDLPIPQETPPRNHPILVEEGAGHHVYLYAVYPAPPISHPDFLPFMVTDALLHGATALAFMGGSVSNRTSRLYRRLIEGDYVLNFQGGLMPTIDPYLFTFTCTLHPDRRVEDVLHALEGEMSRLQDSPPPAEEVQRAIKQARALAAYGSESIYGQGSWLGFDFTVNAGRWHTSFLERLSAVTPQDVQHIAQTYLRPEQRIIGVYRPTTR